MKRVPRLLERLLARADAARIAAAEGRYSMTARPSVLRALVAATLFVALVAAYWGMDTTSIRELDDGYLIGNNPAVQSLRHVPQMFIDPTLLTSYTANQGLRPVLSASYALNWWLTGDRPASYHFLSLLIHVAVVLLVFRLVRTVLAPEDERLAWLAAAAMLLAPLNSEAMLYMSARSASLCTLCYLAAFLLAVRGRVWWALPVQALGLLTKELAITLPAALLLYAWLYDRRVWVAAIPTSAVNVVYLLYRLLFLPPGTLANAAATGVTPWVWLLSTPHALLDYVRRFLLPYDLSLDRASDFHWTPDWSVVLSVTLLAIGLFAAWRTRDRLVRFAVGWFLLVLLPEHSLFVLAETENDHRPYLAITLGLAPLFARLLVRALQPKALAPVCALLLLGSVLTIRHQVWLWQDSVRLWQATAAGSANGRAWMNVANALLPQRQYTLARWYLDEAKRQYPFYSFIEMQYAALERGEGHKALALQHAQEAIRLSGGLPLAYTQLRLAEAMP